MGRDVRLQRTNTTQQIRKISYIHGLSVRMTKLFPNQKNQSSSKYRVQNGARYQHELNMAATSLHGRSVQHGGYSLPATPVGSTWRLLPPHNAGRLKHCGYYVLVEKKRSSQWSNLEITKQVQRTRLPFQNKLERRAVLTLEREARTNITPKTMLLDKLRSNERKPRSASGRIIPCAST